MKKKVLILVFVLVSVCIVSVEAAFIVEPSGLASGNFSGTPSWTPQVLASSAPGLTASQSAFGGSPPDIYVYSYTPGTDADNWPVPSYQYFGNGLYATNLEGGQTGYYNVYITWPSSTNVDLDGCDIHIANDGDTVSYYAVNGNTGGTNWIAELWDHDPLAEIHGANGKWLKIAHEVLLTEGNTYTVTQDAVDETYVSMRSAGVMWEFVAVPEPATLLLLGLGGLVLRRRK